jgi:hypothetical protein
MRLRRPRRDAGPDWQRDATSTREPDTGERRGRRGGDVGNTVTIAARRRRPKAVACLVAIVRRPKCLTS